MSHNLYLVVVRINYIKLTCHTIYNLVLHNVCSEVSIVTVPTTRIISEILWLTCELELMRQSNYFTCVGYMVTNSYRESESHHKQWNGDEI